jgi:hypothetical protein
VTLVGERVYDFDLAVFDIDEAIDPVAGLDEECACGVVRDGARGPKRSDMRLRQRYTLHLVQVAADRLQAVSPMSLNPAPPTVEFNPVSFLNAPSRLGCGRYAQLHGIWAGGTHALPIAGRRGSLYFLTNQAWRKG